MELGLVFLLSLLLILGSLSVALAQAGSISGQVSDNSDTGKWSWSRSKLASGDVNGDGRSDAIILYDRGGKTSALYAFISGGTSFTSKRFWLSSTGGFSWLRSSIAP